MSRADGARRERPSRRPSFRPRRPAGPAAPSPALFVSRLGRFAGRLAPFAFLAALLALPLQAQAQTVETLVSNLAQAVERTQTDVENSRAQAFTTGTNPAGYGLNSVDIEYAGSNAMSAAIWTTGSGGSPASLLYPLTPPSSFSAGTLTFTAPANATLDARTTYSVVLPATPTSTLDLPVTMSNSEDSGAADGWRIRNAYHHFFDNNVWQQTTFGNSYMIAIKGTITPPAIVTDGVRVTSTPMARPDTYVLGETIEITVTFDNAVTVNASSVGPPRIQFRLDGSVNRWAEYSSGSGGTALMFDYTVQSGDMDDDGIFLEADFLRLRSGTISAAADNTVAATLTYAEPGLQPGHKVDGSLDNTAATGAPAITGTPQVDQTLEAGIDTIADADNLPTTTFPMGYSFQWVRVASGGTETNVGTNRTYPLTSSDEGSTIRVDVSFTDGGGFSETVPSVATGPVLPAAGPCPAGNDWCATMTVGIVVGGVTATGYAGGRGALDDPSIDYGSKSFAVSHLQTQTGPGTDRVEFRIRNAAEFLPRGTVFNFGGTEFTADASSEQSAVGQYRWDTPAGFGWIDGQKVTVSANLAPAPQSGTVDGTTLVLTHAEDLDTGSTPAANRYTVKLDGGTGPDVSSVAVGARTATLTLATSVTAADIVTVDYDAPTRRPLRDVSGLDAPDFDNFAVTNNTVCAVDLGGRREIWSAEMTVGAGWAGPPIGDPHYHGFNGDLSVGALSDDEFDFGSMTGVRILSIAVFSGELVFDVSGVTPTADDPALRLHVCRDRFDLGDALAVNNHYNWLNSGLDWSHGDKVQLALSASPDATLSALELADDEGGAVGAEPALRPGRGRVHGVGGERRLGCHGDAGHERPGRHGRLPRRQRQPASPTPTGLRTATAGRP